MPRFARITAAGVLVAIGLTGGCSVPQFARDVAGTFSDEARIPPPEAQAFFTAARRGDVDGIRAALAKGVDVNTVEPLYGRTALMRASGFNHLPAVQALLEARSAVTGADIDGDTVLHIAALSGAAAVIPVLVRAGADVNALRTREGGPPLARAVDAQQPAAARALLAAGANPNLRGSGEPAPLEQAIRRADADLVEALLAAKASLTPSTDVSPNAASLLHMAIDDVQDSDPAVVRLLLQAGADARAPDEQGRTPYARAVELASRAEFRDRVAPTVAVFRAAGVRR